MRLPTRTSFHAALLFALSVISVICSQILLRLVVESFDRQSLQRLTSMPEKMYAYGYDFPADLPLNLGDPVEIVVEESSHYSIMGPDAKTEWENHLPYSYGVVLLIGPHNRALYVTVAVIHQVHCIQRWRSELANEGSPDWHHTQHCLNYLREWILCQSDQTLEPGDFALRNFSTAREGATHICRDWRTVYDYMTEGGLKWKLWDHFIIANDVSMDNNGNGSKSTRS
ncbi:hypothetical protein BT96DRAFT_1025266 [Gymnopus androsaceus JB14]|uniref:Uncharacterized protein n=1 Tax=Gymnopus androsaceus JB14 TaxID=1447944 RepID=A0A6A4GSW5_9AGAR|nr:hypothetical protein BT96DRAFT_1025266 [Gymnopus androsaceus JB14]